MTVYVKRPETVEAVQWNKEGDHPRVSLLRDGPPCPWCNRPAEEHGRLQDGANTLGHTVCPGDYVVKEGLAEYVMNRVVFEKHYAKYEA